MIQLHPQRRNPKSRDSRGQALVEFSLMIVIFLAVFIGLIEFGLAFSAKVEVSFASRDAAIAAAESGGIPATADAAIMNKIDQDLTAPADRYKIDHVDIFWATATGAVNNGKVETYSPGGGLFPGWGGWTLVTDQYPSANRCAYIGGTVAGCQPGHTGPDIIGVSIVYRYSWVTPLPGLIGLWSNGLSFTQTNLSTMEPIPLT